MKSIKAAFNKASVHYDTASCIQKNTGQKLVKQLPQTRFPHVMDLGCGTGYTTQQLAKQIKFTHLDAIDIAEAMIETAHSRNDMPTIKFSIGSFDILSANTYNLIFSNMALHWSTEFSVTLANIYAALKPNGIVAFSIPIVGTFDELRPHFNVREFYTPDSVVNMLDQCRFNLKKIHCYKESQSFDNSLNALRSLKKTGATICQTPSNVSYQQNRAAIKNKLINQLTYQIGLFIAEKS